MDLLGIEQPLLGFLTSATLLESGALVEIDEWGTPLLEPEVAVQLGSAVPAGTSPADAAGAIQAVGAAIELVDLGAIDQVEDILAVNIFHRQVLLGEFVDVDPGELDEVQIAVTINGEESEPSDPREVIGDLGQVIASLADQAELTGESFQAGDVIITGAAVPPALIKPGDQYRVALNVASEVEVELT